jgi:hypothetical protein
MANQEFGKEKIMPNKTNDDIFEILMRMGIESRNDPSADLYGLATKIVKEQQQKQLRSISCKDLDAIKKYYDNPQNGGYTLVYHRDGACCVMQFNSVPDQNKYQFQPVNSEVFFNFLPCFLEL